MMVGGLLVIEAHGAMGRSQIPMSTLDVFDFGTAALCWSKNKLGKYEVAAFLAEGHSCPGNTEKDVKKLDDIASYLKF